MLCISQYTSDVYLQRYDWCPSIFALYALCLFSYSTIFISSCTSIFHFKQDPILCCMLNIYFQRYAWFLRVFMYFPMRFVSVYHCTHCVCFPMTIRGYFLHMLYLFPTVRLYGCSVPVYVFHVYFPLYVCMAVQFQCTYFMCISHCTSVWLFSSTVRMLCVFPTVRLCGCSVLLCALWLFPRREIARLSVSFLVKNRPQINTPQVQPLENSRLSGNASRHVLND